MSQLLLAFYGDDFTGSTDCMEMLERGGVPTVLFLQTPSAANLAQFPDARAIGVAGGSRTFSPAEMDATLPKEFAALRDLGSPIVHYKICSTFDSSPTCGSIGRAIDIGRSVFSQETVPVLVGAPMLGRHVVFGNLFARSGLDSEPFRLDRHPTMSRHPVTPMDEADLRLVLAKQTTAPIGLVDVLTIEAGFDALNQRANKLRESGAGVLIFDTVNAAHMALCGQFLRTTTNKPLRFVVGSSGVEQALVAQWKQSGLLPPHEFSPGYAVEKVIVVSGSCSPVTSRQIAAALPHGFEAQSLEVDTLLNPATTAAGIEAGIALGLKILANGRSPILHTAMGPEDIRAIPAEHRADLGRRLGEALADIVRGLVQATGLRRAIVCGGDTSTFVAQRLGLTALRLLAPIAPGGPLCTATSTDPLTNGLEIMFKGGQVGRDSVFVDARAGREQAKVASINA